MGTSVAGSEDGRVTSAAGDAPPRALLVEDDLDQRVLLTRLLERAGYAVLAVPSATAALAVPGPGSDPVRPIRIILLDLRLPDLDGRDLLARLRERHPGCPVVVCSVLDVQDYPAADGVLPKPVTSAALRRVLDDLTTRGATP